MAAINAVLFVLGLGIVAFTVLMPFVHALTVIAASL